MTYNTLPKNFIKFLGTAGARVVLSQQLRSSGGTWLRLGQYNLMVDPGPGTLLRCWGSEPPLDPSTLDTIVLTHRHLDHSGDMNAMVEAMTKGGYQRRGIVIVPEDALSGPEPILFHYLRHHVHDIQVMAPGKEYKLGEVVLKTPIRHIHPVETYGISIAYRDIRLAWITDTRFFPELITAYKSDILIVNMTFVKPFYSDKAYHMSSEEAIPLIKGINPQQVILTHFGKTVLDEGAELIARSLHQQTGIPVIAATDGMIYELLNQGEAHGD